MTTTTLKNLTLREAVELLTLHQNVYAIYFEDDPDGVLQMEDGVLVWRDHEYKKRAAAEYLTGERLIANCWRVVVWSDDRPANSE